MTQVVQNFFINSFWKENSKLAPLSQSRKTLIALADDQDSGNNKITLSKELNIVYHSMTNKLVSFVEEYYDGFKPFDKFQQNTITLYEKHCKEYIETKRFNILFTMLFIQ